MDGLEHVWETSSQHRTSQGVVRYQRCHCGLRRITVDEEHVVADRVGGRRCVPAMLPTPADPFRAPGPAEGHR